MRKIPARITCALVASSLLTTLGPALLAQVPAGTDHGIMRPDAATRARWEAERLAAVPAPGTRFTAGLGTVTGTLAPPASFSLLGWVPDSATPASWNQAGCGSCWVWAATAMTEVALKKTCGIVDRLSIQYFQSNKTDSWACDGGSLTAFFQWYNNQDSRSPNANPGILVPRSNPQAAYADASPEATYQLASTVPPVPSNSVS